MNFRFAKEIFINHSVIVSANIENYSFGVFTDNISRVKREDNVACFFPIGSF
jgi:hypothetical protein